MGLQKNAVTPDWVGVLSNCTVVLSRDTVLASPSLFFQLQPKNGELQMVSKIIIKELLSLELLIIIIIRSNFFTAGLQNFWGRGWHFLPRFGINI